MNAELTFTCRCVRCFDFFESEHELDNICGPCFQIESEAEAYAE